MSIDDAIAALTRAREQLATGGSAPLLMADNLPVTSLDVSQEHGCVFVCDVPAEQLAQKQATRSGRGKVPWSN